jgi:cytochrome c-type biogenesis protein CcmH
VTGFTLLAAALVVGALLFVVPPMLGFGRRRREHAARQRQADTALVVLREQLADLEADRAAGRLTDADYRRAREEVEMRALEEGRAAEDGADTSPARFPAVALAVTVPALAVFFYLWIGEPDALDPVKVAGEPPHEISADQMAGLVAQLAQRLEADPSDPTGWLMLVRSYAMMGDLDAAAATWRRIGDKAPDDAGILADWADILVAGTDGDFSGEPDRLIARALELEPDNFKALALAGSAAFQRSQYQRAVEHWEKILAQIPPTEDGYTQVLASVNEARTRAGLAPLGDNGAAATAPQLSSALGLTGTLTLAETFHDQVLPDETIFVFVRPAAGGIPVAALRFRVADLPVDFDFRTAELMTQSPLPEQVVVAARLSRGGDATARPGDLEGASGVVAVDAVGVRIVIDSVRE